MKNKKENVNTENSNLPISDVRQRCFNAVKKVLSNVVTITDVIDWYLISELDFIEIITIVEKDFDYNINDNDIDVQKFDTINDLVNWLASNVA